MRTVFTYPDRLPSNTEFAWDEEWQKYTLKRTLMWNEHCETIRILEEYLPKNGKIIEAGCGLGRIVIHFKNKGYDIVGIDWSKKSIQTIKEYDPQLSVEEGDLRKFNYADGIFSAYISEGVIEHFADGPMAILQEAHRVLVDKGLLLISIPIYNALMRVTLPIKESNCIRRLFRKCLLDKSKERKFDYYLFTRREFRTFIRSAGFEIVEMRPTLQAAGLYRCLPFFRNRRIASDFDIWGHTDRCLNGFGRLFLHMFKYIMPWAFATCAYCIARKR